MLKTILSKAVIIASNDFEESKSPLYVLYLKCNRDVEPPSKYIPAEMDWISYGKKGESYPLCISQKFDRLRDLVFILKYFKYCRTFFSPLIDTFENFNQFLPKCAIEEEDAEFYFGEKKFYIDHFYFSTMFNTREDSLILPIEESGPTLIRNLII